MKTLQECLNQKYPTKEDKKEVKAISCLDFKDDFVEGGELDLSEFKNVEDVFVIKRFLKAPLTKLNVSGCVNLQDLDVSGNNLTSVDFLNNIPNPKKLKWLTIYNNNIEPTDIEIFSKFTSLIGLMIGTTETVLEEGKQNHFYGSLKSYQNLTELKMICIEATDINEGLEYLPFSLVQVIKEKDQEKKYSSIECSPHDINAKCKVIQNQLRPFNYDLEAWQLAYPEKMLISRPKLFAETSSREKWINALSEKIRKTQRELEITKSSESDKIKKIARLESKLESLQGVKENLEKSTQTEIFTADKETQTDLTSKQIEEMEKVMEQLRKIEIPKK